MTIPRTPPAAPPKRAYLTIQALRFLAALMVVVVHSTFYSHERLTAAMPVYSEGANGVRLFFVISGFVMIVASQKLIGEAGGWRVFALRRILRIVPLYWLILSIKAVVLIFTTGLVLHAKLDWAVVWKSFLFIPAYNADGAIEPLLGVGWTLNFEMFFYLLFTITLLARLRPLVTLAPVLVMFALLGLVRDAGWPVPLYYYSNPIVLDFLAGMAIATWAARERTLPEWSGWLLAGAGLFYLFVPLPHTPLPFVNSLLITLAAAAVVLAAVVLEGRIGHRVPRFAVFMGAASYSLYLIHPLVAPVTPQLFAKVGLMLPSLAVVGSIVSALVAGALCYRFVELPISDRLDRATRHRRWFSTTPRDSVRRPVGYGAETK
ncbi:acyltransferase [Sphingomonas sp. VNH70]|uniref:acyltransferase family protein n=1 Tax=Sphingomonas silueang TaxID=3156617 RepID=UPI0032B586AE